MSDWAALEQLRDTEGFAALAALKGAAARVGLEVLAKAVGVPVLVVQRLDVLAAPADDEVASFRRTVDADRGTERFQKGGGDPGRYQGRVAFLLKRAGNPFPHMVTVGRAANSDITVSLGTVSKVHAYFLKEAGGWVLVDQRSTNGTFVDGVRLAPTAKHALADGATIRFGEQLVAAYTLPPALLSLLRS